MIRRPPRSTLFPSRRSSDLLDRLWDLAAEAGVTTFGTGAAFIASCLKAGVEPGQGDRKSTRLNSSHSSISYAVFCLKKKKQRAPQRYERDPQRERYAAALFD